MDLKLTGRTALVTGSSKGIGLAVAQWFAREGVNVCLVARSGDRLEKEGAAIAKETGVKVRTLAADLADASARERVFQTFPDVDILVNNAGAIPGGSLDDVDEPAWRAGWDLKVFGYVGLTRLYLRMMRERKRGVIIKRVSRSNNYIEFADGSIISTWKKAGNVQMFLDTSNFEPSGPGAKKVSCPGLPESLGLAKLG